MTADTNEPDTVDLLGVSVGNIADLGIELEELVKVAYYD